MEMVNQLVMFPLSLYILRYLSEMAMRMNSAKRTSKTARLTAIKTKHRTNRTVAQSLFSIILSLNTKSIIAEVKILIFNVNYTSCCFHLQKITMRLCECRITIKTVIRSSCRNYYNFIVNPALEIMYFCT